MNGPLSNRLYALADIERKRREAEERKARLCLAIVFGLGFFIILVAIVRSHA